MKHLRYLTVTAGIALLLALVSPLAWAAVERSKLKVHKDRVELSVPDAHGLVRVSGRTGAIEGDRDTEVELLRVSAHVLEVTPDGSFSAEIGARGGDQIVLVARDAYGRQSRGSFTVPHLDPAGTIHVLRDPPHDFTVQINIIDNTSGHVYAQRQTAQIVPVAAHDRHNQRGAELIERIIRRCLEATAEEIVAAGSPQAAAAADQPQ